jgi:hypothetical protein
MDVRDRSEEHVSEGDGLKLTNRLNESRSPYVSASAVSTPKYATRLTMDPAGSRTHEQPGGMADVGSGGLRAREEVEQADIH